jgi:hypothetical protein
MTRVFVIHAPEDYLFFDQIATQARNAKLPVEFDRMQVKQPWVPGWKGQCRTRIYKCGGAVVLISKHTNQGGVGWELECAQAFDIPMLGVHIDKPNSGAVPEELRDAAVIDWNWPAIARFIQSLTKGSSAYA